VFAVQIQLSGSAQIMGGLGICVAPCTILRWVIRYSVNLAETWLPYERAVGRSWRCDETYIKVGGEWMHLYRAVDACGKRWNRTKELFHFVAAAIGLEANLPTPFNKGLRAQKHQRGMWHLRPVLLVQDAEDSICHVLAERPEHVRVAYPKASVAR